MRPRRRREAPQQGRRRVQTGWFGEPMLDRYAASNYYFAQAIVRSRPRRASAETSPRASWATSNGSARARHRRRRGGRRLQGAAHLSKRILGANESATYKQVAYLARRSATCSLLGRVVARLQDSSTWGPSRSSQVPGVGHPLDPHEHQMATGAAIIALTLGCASSCSRSRGSRSRALWPCAASTRDRRAEREVKDDAQAKNLR